MSRYTKFQNQVLVEEIEFLAVKIVDILKAIEKLEDAEPQNTELIERFKMDIILYRWRATKAKELLLTI